MKKLSKLLVSFVGEFPYLCYLDLRAQYIPSASQKKAKESEKLELEKSVIFYSAFIKPNDLCLDIGANMGSRVKTFLSLGARVVAVEPQKSCARYLKWKYGNQIEIVNKGLGEKEEVKDFFLSPASVTSTFSKEYIDIMRKTTPYKENLSYLFLWNKVVKVEMTTLDKIISQFGKPDFIKIDVEGFELEVLRGLNQPVKMLSFECHIPAMIESALECIDRFSIINSDSRFNYSNGESMTFYFKKWLNKMEMIDSLKNKEFINSHKYLADFGDIYVRSTEQ